MDAHSSNSGPQFMGVPAFILQFMGVPAFIPRMTGRDKSAYAAGRRVYIEA